MHSTPDIWRFKTKGSTNAAVQGRPLQQSHGGARTIQTLLSSSEPFQHFGSELARPGCLSSHIVRSSTRQLSLAELLRLICNDRMHPQQRSGYTNVGRARRRSFSSISFPCGLTSLQTRPAVGRHTSGLGEIVFNTRSLLLIIVG